LGQGLTIKAKPFSGTGDRGDTSTATGRSPKDSPVIEALGSVDELVAFLGLARTKVKGHEEVSALLKEVQKTLFRYAAVLHGMKGYDITHEDVLWLEQRTLAFDKRLPGLRNFILPSGSEAAATIHVARAVCRRTERSVVALSRKEKIPENCIPFINRLSSLLFVLARYVNYEESQPEELV
jgi:cob(I)alamin adenosyltransferase